MQATYKLLYIKQMSYDAFFGTSCNLAQDAQNIFLSLMPTSLYVIHEEKEVPFSFSNKYTK